MTQTQHTPGPLNLKDERDYKVCNSAIVGPHYVVARAFHGPDVNDQTYNELWAECEANARLLAAAYTSYDKHCGPRAIACAEGDLLGELLEAVTELLRNAEYADGQAIVLTQDCEALEAAIAKARGEG